MVDYSIDGSFDLHFSQRNNFATVTGREEFHQNVIIDIHHRLKNLTGDADSYSNLTEKINLQVSRTAKKYNKIDSIEKINVSRLFNKPGTVSVEIVYGIDDSFQETI